MKRKEVERKRSKKLIIASAVYYGWDYLNPPNYLLTPF